MVILLYVICCFFTDAYFFSSIFVSLVSVCVSMFLLGFILNGTLHFVDLGVLFLFPC